jgi:hypothetical protein
MKKVKMLWTRNLDKEDKNRTQNFGKKPLGKQPLERPRTNEKIILTFISGN